MERGETLAQATLYRSQASRYRASKSDFEKKRLDIEHQIERLEVAKSRLATQLFDSQYISQGIISLKSTSAENFRGERASKYNAYTDEVKEAFENYIKLHQDNQEKIQQKIQELRTQSDDLQTQINHLSGTMNFCNMMAGNLSI